jgi:NIMA-interacting peptidyl-prolyl cis-trans isomerase 1
MTTSEQKRSHQSLLRNDFFPWAVLCATIVGGGVVARACANSPAAATPVAPQASAARAVTPALSALASAHSASRRDDDAPMGAIHLVVTDKDTAMGAAEHVTRTREQARARAGAARDRARKGEDFDKLVMEYSDEPSVKQLHGVLISFRKQDTLPGFGDAVARLPIGGISDIVQTPLGFHVIKRTK